MAREAGIKPIGDLEDLVHLTQEEGEELLSAIREMRELERRAEQEKEKRKRTTKRACIRLPGAFRKRITGSRSWMLGSLTRRPTRPLGWPVSASDTAERGFGIADVSGRAWPATPRTNRSSA